MGSGRLVVPPTEGSREEAQRAADSICPGDPWVLVYCWARAQKMAGMLEPWGGRCRKGILGRFRAHLGKVGSTVRNGCFQGGL